MDNPIKKRVRLTLVGRNGNAFALLGAFTNAAKKEGWTAEEIETVTSEAMSGDYNHLVATLMNYSDDPDEDANEPRDDE